MDYIDYRTKLGLGFNDKEKQDLFTSRVQTFLCSHGDWPLSEKDERNFCFLIGVDCLIKNTQEWEDVFGNSSKGLQRIGMYLDKKRASFADFLASLVLFANNYGTNEQRKTIAYAIKQSLELSHIQFMILNDDDGIFYFPKGAQELDDALVSQPLEWLSQYPSARKLWIEALKLYSSNAVPYDIADKFRKALERFFQEFFNQHNVSLEKMLSVYGDYLFNNGIPKEISNELQKLLDLYTKFNNNNAKHQDKATANVLEYLMYQTGNIIRLLITLRQEETENAD